MLRRGLKDGEESVSVHRKLGVLQGFSQNKDLIGVTGCGRITHMTNKSV